MMRPTKTALLVFTTAVLGMECPRSGLLDNITDADSDGTANHADNCPATANPDQADLNGDGIGDACASATGGRYAIRTSRGVVEVLLDSCGRPVALVDADGWFSLAWSANGQQIVITSHQREGMPTITVAPDWSEAAILARLDGVEAQTGIPQTERRSWLEVFPNGTAQSAGCVGLAFSKSGASAQGQFGLPQPHEFETLGDYMRHLNEQCDYWEGLRDAVLNLQAIYDGPIPLPFERMLEHIASMETRSRALLLNESQECLPCSATCDIPCAEYGACYRNGQCDERRRPDCDAVGGQFFPGASCDYGCCVTANGVTRCVNVTLAGCRQIDRDDVARAYHLFPGLCERHANPCP